MSEELEQLKRKYFLDPEKVNSIADRIIRNNTIGVTTSKEPKAIILGGQPGAGKGELTTQAQLILGVNTVICNADNYRVQHPQHKEININHEQYYPDITADYSLDWNGRLKKYCEDHRFNYILETTFSSGERMNATIKEMRNNGYNVSIMLLSINHNLSFLGTKLRYESMRAQDGFGRTVSKEQHDLRYEQIIGTLRVVLKEKIYNNIYIYGRASRQKQKGTTVGLRRISLNSKDPLKDYLDERDKFWSENDLRYFTSDILKLIKQMVFRGAGNDELKQIFEVFDIENTESLLAPDSYETNQ